MRMFCIPEDLAVQVGSSMRSVIVGGEIRRITKLVSARQGVRVAMTLFDLDCVPEMDSNVPLRKLARMKLHEVSNAADTRQLLWSVKIPLPKTVWVQLYANTEPASRKSIRVSPYVCLIICAIHMVVVPSNVELRRVKASG